MCDRSLKSVFSCLFSSFKEWFSSGESQSGRCTLFSAAKNIYSTYYYLLYSVFFKIY
jgi:hypothetical protein